MTRDEELTYLDRELAKIAGTDFTTTPPAGERTAWDEVEPAMVREALVESHPWAAPLSDLEARGIVAWEADLAGLYSSRMGEPVERGAERARALAAEAWRPLAPGEDLAARADRVRERIAAERAHLAKLPPFPRKRTTMTAETATPPARPQLRAIREGDKR